MKYHLDTIPVWEAMESETHCPLCALFEKCEADEIDKSLGGSVMEPDVRIRVNEKGICQKHHLQLYAMQNRLGHALMTDSHSKEVLQKLNAIRTQAEKPVVKGFMKKVSPAADAAKALRDISSSCIICENVDTHMERYVYTFLHLWKKDSAFRKKWLESDGVCMPHAALLLERVQKHLSADEQQLFCTQVLSLLTKSLEADEKDLEWFTLKFDYRNQSKPWGNSRTALGRTIDLLRGKCVDQVSTEKDQA